MTRRTARTLFFVFSASILPNVAHAGQILIALGDSITRGETDLQYVPSLSTNAGYVGLVAHSLAAQNGGAPPNVINLAIDGETSASFTSGSGRVPPVTGRGDAILAAENLNYNPNALVSQGQLFQAAVKTQQGMGNTVSTVTMTMGGNDLFALATMPGFTPGSANDPMVAAALATYRANESAILANIRSLLPDATIDLIGVYNPFPADPTNTFGPLAAAAGPMFNSVLRSLAAQYGAHYIDTAPLFVGHEAQYTYEAALPQGSSVGGTYGGTLPLGDVHPNALGYGVIADAVIAANAVPEPASLVLVGLALIPLVGAGRAKFGQAGRGTEVA